jgi:hypothetical protein
MRGSSHPHYDAGNGGESGALAVRLSPVTFIREFFFRRATEASCPQLTTSQQQQPNGLLRTPPQKLPPPRRRRRVPSPGLRLGAQILAKYP